jgi:hypothetical protein
MSVVPDAPIGSVAELIDLREQLEGPLPDAMPSMQWAYRGQPRAFNSLAPSFQRQFSRQSIGAARIIERKLLEAFREHYARLPDAGHDMPTPVQVSTEHDLRCLSVMQHYEIPTRLLDWSSSFWTSLYFACSNDPGENAELWFYHRSIFDDQRTQDPSLKALIDKSANPPAEPPFLDGPPNWLEELDPQISPRMRQQIGHHTVSSSVFSDHAPMLRQLDIEMGNAGPPRLQRVIIAASCKSKALQFLADTMNINAGTIFPDVVGLGRFLRWQFDSLRTMML